MVVEAARTTGLLEPLHQAELTNEHAAVLQPPHLRCSLLLQLKLLCWLQGHFFKLQRSSSATSLCFGTLWSVWRARRTLRCGRPCLLLWAPLGLCWKPCWMWGHCRALPAACSLLTASREHRKHMAWLCASYRSASPFLSS